MITLNCKMSIWITVEMFPICFWRLVCCNISIGRYSVHLRSPYQVMQQLFCLVFCQWKLRKKRKKKKSRSQLVLSWFRLLRVRKKNAFSTENSGDVMSWSHARDRDHAATVLAGGMTIRMDGWMAPFHVSTGLGTILFGVSGNWEDKEVTSLPEEFPRDPDSEKDTWVQKTTYQNTALVPFFFSFCFLQVWKSSFTFAKHTTHTWPNIITLHVSACMCCISVFDRMLQNLLAIVFVHMQCTSSLYKSCHIQSVLNTHTSCWKAGWSRSLCRANSLKAFHGGW